MADETDDADSTGSTAADPAPNAVRSPSPRERQLAGLHPPWRKGESGNPSGRPSEFVRRRRMFQDDIPMLLNKLKLIALKREDMVAVAAANAFMDRVEGKVPQAIIDRAQRPMADDVWSGLSDDQLDEIIQREGALPEGMDAEYLAREEATG
jgi:parvulin-like peptidyl-prolyl isomerase